MTTLSRYVFSAIIAMLIAWPSLAGEEETAETGQIDARDPHALIVQSTDNLLAKAREPKDYFAEDPDRYYREIGRFVEQVVDIERFTRGVMASYASARRYRALDTDEERKAFRERVDRFAEILKDSLITTYSKALINAGGVRIETKPPPAGVTDDADYAAVEQVIYSDDGTPYHAQYSLRRDDSGDWKLYNISVEGINIGMVFRSQFASLVEKHGGDVDAAIEQWRDEQHPIPINHKGDSQ